MNSHAEEKSMKLIARQGRVVPAVLVLVCAAGLVWAANPHFIKVTSALQPNGDLNVSFKEAGLGDTATDYLAEADATATCTCVTKSGQCPNAANKVTFTEEVSAAGTFSPKNGNVVATLTIAAPACPSSDPPTCGAGQQLTLSAISYTDIQITDTTHNVGPEAANPSSISATFFTCP
jgi:hypothetical protein